MAHDPKIKREFKALNISILTVSDSRTEETDTSGRLLADRVTQAGHQFIDKQIQPDDIYRIRATVSQWIADPGIDAIITTGGTGITGRDGTPEAIRPLMDKIIDGFGELFRALSFDGLGTSTIQSRAMSGVANGTYIFCLPGSRGACADGWDKLISHQLDFRTQPCNLAELMPRLMEK